MLVTVLVLFASFVRIGLAASIVCTSDKLQECYNLLVKDMPSSSPAVLNYPEDVMTEHCRRYKIFSECMKTIRPYCSESTNQSILVYQYQGIDDAYGFVCGEGFAGYIKYQSPCFKEDDVQSEGKTCSDIYATRLNYLKQNVTDKKYRRARYCQYVDDYIDCIYNLLLSFCGEEAAKWHKTFDTKSVQPVMVSLGCPGWPIKEPATTDKPNTAIIWIITLGVAIVVTGIMVAIGLSLLICSRCRCQRRTSSRSISVDMPPPYSGPPFIVSTSEEDDDSASTSTRPASSMMTDTTSIRSNDTRTGRKTNGKMTASPTPPEVGSRSSEMHRTKEDAVETNGRVGYARTVSSSGTVFEEADGVEGAVGGSPPSPFVRSYTPTGHFELPSPGSSLLSFLQSSDDDTTSLISHTCDYY